MRLELVQTFAVGTAHPTAKISSNLCCGQRRNDMEVSSHLCASRQDSAHPTADILEMLAENVSVTEVLEDFPDLELADIQACMLFAARRTDFIRRD